MLSATLDILLCESKASELRPIRNRVADIAEGRVPDGDVASAWNSVLDDIQKFEQKHKVKILSSEFRAAQKRNHGLRDTLMAMANSLMRHGERWV